jgi:alkylresorcinol/alkylpyrone synthase
VSPARIASVATAVPPHALDQADVRERVRAQFQSSAVVARLMPVFENTGIMRRFSSVPIDWYYDTHGWKDRNDTYVQVAVDVLESAATRALADAGKRIEDVDTLVVVSTTGIATPSLDALLLERLPFKRTVRRLPIFGLGCVGGALGLARAASLAQVEPGSVVLLLVVELCALWFRRDELTKSNIVATALFGDGGAAVVLSTDAAGPAIAASGEYTFAGTLPIMGWDVAEDGLAAIFSRDIPQLVRTQFRGVLDEYLADADLTRAHIDCWLSHPGGPKVLDALEDAFGIEPNSLEDSRAVLRDYGNMSAVTLLFVLDRALRQGALTQTWRHAVLTAMGPGFTAGFVTLVP